MVEILLVPSGGIFSLNQLSPADTLLRCERGLKMWERGSFDKILVTGGIYSPSNIQTLPAAELMAQWFRQKGVPAGDIIIEPRSLDTFENIKFSLEELGRLSINNFRITVVTQWQHVIRFWITFCLGYNIRVKIQPMNYAISFRTWLEEWFFIIYHLYDRRGTKYFARKNRRNRTQLKQG